MTTKLSFSLLAVSCLAMAPAFAQSSNAQEQDSLRIHKELIVTLRGPVVFRQAPLVLRTFSHPSRPALHRLPAYLFS